MTTRSSRIAPGEERKGRAETRPKGQLVLIVAIGTIETMTPINALMNAVLSWIS